MKLYFDCFILINIYYLITYAIYVVYNMQPCTHLIIYLHLIVIKIFLNYTVDKQYYI